MNTFNPGDWIRVRGNGNEGDMEVIRLEGDLVVVRDHHDNSERKFHRNGLTVVRGHALVAGLTPAEHEEWVEEAHGKNPAPLTYEETAQLLRAKLDRSEFLALQELLDGDADHSLYEEISKLAAEMAPELFGSPSIEESFDAVHSQMAKLGMCDGTGGVEYSRVLRQWNDAGRPAAIAEFIYRKANVSPGSDPNEKVVAEAMRRLNASRPPRLGH